MEVKGTIFVASGDSDGGRSSRVSRVSDGLLRKVDGTTVGVADSEGEKVAALIGSVDEAAGSGLRLEAVLVISAEGTKVVTAFGSKLSLTAGLAEGLIFAVSGNAFTRSRGGTGQRLVATRPLGGGSQDATDSQGRNKGLNPNLTADPYALFASSRLGDNHFVLKQIRSKEREDLIM